LGLNASTVPGVRTTADAPAASAERKMVPRFPGSEMPSATTTHSAVLIESMPNVRRRTIAITGCGEVVEATRSRTPFSRMCTGVSLPNTAVPSGATNCSSTCQPALIASAISVGPSTTKQPSSIRSLRRLASRRSRCTRGCVKPSRVSLRRAPLLRFLLRL